MTPSTNSAHTSAKKPWYRPRNVVLTLLAAVVLLIGWVVIEIMMLMKAEPNPTVDYLAQFRPLSMKAGDLPDSHDGEAAWWDMVDALEAAQAILQAHNQMIKADPDWQPRSEFDDGSIDFYYVFSGGTIPDNADREIRAIEALREAGVFDSLAEFAMAAPGFRPRIPSAGNAYDALLPELALGRGLASARRASMRLALRDGDMDAVVDAFDQTMAVAQTFSHDMFLISHLVGFAIEATMLDELSFELTEAEFDEPTCRMLLNTLAQRKPPSFSLSLEAERHAFRDIVQWSFTDDGTGDGYLLPDQMALALSGGFSGAKEGDLISATWARFIHDGRAETLQAYDDLVDRQLAEMEKRPVDRWKGEFDPYAFGLDQLRTQLVIDLYFPAFPKAMDTAHQIAVERAGVRIMLGLELFHARNGHWPQGLNELVPEVFAKMPVDPLHGGPFGYRLLEDDEPGRPYLLYSTGFDQTDDGGVELPETASNGRRTAIMDQDATGIDFVINEPRPEWEY